MTSKRQNDRLPALYFEADAPASIAPRERMPGQRGYPQAHEIERLRHLHVTRIRKLKRR